MRIGIDASPITDRKTGVGRYTYELLSALGRLDRTNEYRLFLARLRGRVRGALFEEFKNFNIRRMPLPGRTYATLWRYFDWPPIENFVGPCDLFFSPNFYIPPMTGGKLVVTIHDLYFMRHPEQTKGAGGRYFFKTLPKRIHRADGIIAVSEATRRDIIEIFNVPPEKICAIHSGVESSFKEADANARTEIRHRLNAETGYILYVGALEPRKNLRRLITAFAAAKKQGAPQKLVLVGPKGWQYSDVFREIKNLNVEQDIICPGYLGDELIPAVYSAADLLVFPSLCEGFGFPIVEAMACGCPVLTSNVSSMPEVGGDACAYVDPENEEQIAKSLTALLNDPGMRKTLSEKGKQRAAIFNWNTTAVKTLDFFNRVANGKL